MSTYEVIIYGSNDDDVFIAEVPELPGCAADGSPYREALANVEVVIREWIEPAKETGRQIPVPDGAAIRGHQVFFFFAARFPGRVRSSAVCTSRLRFA